jgi:phage-related protein
VGSGPTFCRSITFFRFLFSHHLVSFRCRYYIDPTYLTIRGKPSVALAKRLEADEKVRIAAQVEQMGPEGLNEAARTLTAAIEVHNEKIPTSLITSLSVPGVKSISWIPVQSVQQKGIGREALSTGLRSGLGMHLASDDNDLPFFVQYDHVKVRLSLKHQH